MANLNRRLKRIVRKAIKDNPTPPASPKVTALGGREYLEGERDRVRKERDRLQRIENPTHQQRKRMIQLDADDVRLTKALGGE